MGDKAGSWAGRGQGAAVGRAGGGETADKAQRPLHLTARLVAHRWASSCPQGSFHFSLGPQSPRGPPSQSPLLWALFTLVPRPSHPVLASPPVLAWRCGADHEGDPPGPSPELSPGPQEISQQEGQVGEGVGWPGELGSVEMREQGGRSRKVFVFPSSAEFISDDCIILV